MTERRSGAPAPSHDPSSGSRAEGKEEGTRVSPPEHVAELDDHVRSASLLHRLRAEAEDEERDSARDVSEIMKLLREMPDGLKTGILRVVEGALERMGAAARHLANLNRIAASSESFVERRVLRRAVHPRRRRTDA